MHTHTWKWNKIQGVPISVSQWSLPLVRHNYCEDVFTMSSCTQIGKSSTEPINGCSHTHLHYPLKPGQLQSRWPFFPLFWQPTVILKRRVPARSNTATETIRLPWYVRQFARTVTSCQPGTAATLWITILTRCSPAQPPPVLVVMFLLSSHSFSPHPHPPTGTTRINPHAPLSWTVKPAPSAV